MTRPRIARIGKKDRCKFIQQPSIGYFARIVLVQMRWDEQRFERVNDSHTTNPIGTLLDGPQICLNPVLRNFPIRIRSENSTFRHQGGSMFHSQPTGHACARRLPLKVAFDNMQPVARYWERSHYFRRVVCAVVQQQHNMVCRGGLT